MHKVCVLYLDIGLTSLMMFSLVCCRVEARINSMSLYTHRQVFHITPLSTGKLFYTFEEFKKKKPFVLIFKQIFTLPKDTLVYPAHDYKGYEVMQKGKLKIRFIHDTVALHYLYVNVSGKYSWRRDATQPAFN